MSGAVLTNGHEGARTTGNGVDRMTMADPTGLALAVLIERVEACGNVAELRAWLLSGARVLGGAGCHYVHVGHSLVDPDHRDREWPARFLSTRAWEGGRDAAAWLVHDPVATQIRGAFAPFAWSTRASTEHSLAEQAWLASERAQGVAGGIAVPVQDYSAGPAYLSFFGIDPAQGARLVEQHAPELAYLGLRFHDQAKRLLTLSVRAHVQNALTGREIDCLRLAALGRTVAETGQALGITARTVEFHLKNASEKLGAASKVRAVAIAVSRGLIHF
jgi:LuxR family transcriptional regulator, activator of conjugal transfer of Ti plasmids